MDSASQVSHVHLLVRTHAGVTHRRLCAQPAADAVVLPRAACERNKIAFSAISHSDTCTAASVSRQSVIVQKVFYVSSYLLRELLFE